MSIAVFDIGGSAVKYGLWKNEKLEQTSSFPTPENFEDLKDNLNKVIKSYREKVDGVGFSAPGAVNVKERRIDGISAVPYIHERPIFDQLEESLGLPITIENDANCAGICEVEIGAGKGSDSAVFIVIGTGIGGSIFINGKIYKGAHLFAGELGLMQSTNGKSLSYNGTASNVASRFSKKINRKITGKELYELSDTGNKEAILALEQMYDYIAEAVYNIQVSIDPQVIIFGGGISARPELVGEISKRYKKLTEKFEIPMLDADLRACQYQNDANLIGAALNFQNLNAK